MRHAKTNSAVMIQRHSSHHPPTPADTQQSLHPAEEFAQAIIDALSSHVCVLNEQGTIIAVNQVWKDFSRASLTDLAGGTVSDAPESRCLDEGADYLGTCDRAIGPDASNAFEFAAGIRAVLSGSVEHFSLEYPCHSPKEQRWFIGRVKKFTIGAALRILIEHVDITERRLAEQVVQRSEEKFRQMAGNVKEVFWMMNAAATEILYVSPAYEHVWGQTSQSLYTNPESWLYSVHPDDRARTEERFRRQLQGEDIDNEYRIVKPSGAVRWIRNRAFSVRDDNGDIVRVAGVAENTTERKLSEIQLAYQARYDELTGLPNRILFRDRVQSAVHTGAHAKSGAIFFIDLDRFKLVNDTLGHSAGDLLLQQVSQRFLDTCGNAGTIARLGGDEFMFVTDQIEDHGAVRKLAGQLISCLKEPFVLADRELFITASIGISLFPEHGTDPELLKSEADLAMHEAKRTGKNQLKFFTEDLANQSRKRLQMETSLHQALARSEFELRFQPQFKSGISRPIRFEALIRWSPAGGNPIPPLEFIASAEQNGLIVPIGTWVLREACQRCSDWQTGNLRGVGVAVNISYQQFLHSDLAEVVLQTLKLTGLPPYLLELEVTESIFIDDFQASALTLTQLKNLGVTIALDDFGTGYSSLSYLQNLPLDALKIDRSFLMETERRVSGVAILRCVVDLAHALGLRVVAEGVETADQRVLLGNLGCDEMQGFLLGEPLWDPNGVDEPEKWCDKSAQSSVIWGTDRALTPALQ